MITGAHDFRLFFKRAMKDVEGKCFWFSSRNFSHTLPCGRFFFSKVLWKVIKKAQHDSRHYDSRKTFFISFMHHWEIVKTIWSLCTVLIQQVRPWHMRANPINICRVTEFSVEGTNFVFFFWLDVFNEIFVWQSVRIVEWELNKLWAILHYHVLKNKTKIMSVLRN